MLQDIYNLLTSLNYKEIDLSKGAQTKALQRQKEASMDPKEQWWSTCLENGYIKHYATDGKFYLHSEKYSNNCSENVTKSFVHESYLSWIDRFKPNNKERITNSAQFGKKFKKMVCAGDSCLVNSNQKDNNGKNAYKLAHCDVLCDQFYNRYK